MLEEITAPILGMPQYLPEGAAGSAFITDGVRYLVFIYRTVFTVLIASNVKPCSVLESQKDKQTSPLDSFLLL